MQIKTFLAAALFLAASASFAKEVDWDSCKPFCVTDVKGASATLLSGSNKKKIPMTVVSLQAARDILKAQGSDPTLPYEYVLDGALARSHILGKNLAAAGIESAKAWVAADILKYDSAEFGRVAWDLQVATVLLVEQNKVPVPFVIDVGLSPEPLPYAQWKKLFEGSVQIEGFTNRFAFLPEDFMRERTAYEEEDLAAAQEDNKLHGQALKYLRSRRTDLVKHGLQGVVNVQCHAGDYVQRLVAVSEKDWSGRVPEIKRLQDERRKEIAREKSELQSHEEENDGSAQKRYEAYVRKQKAMSLRFGEQVAMEAIEATQSLEHARLVAKARDALMQEIDQKENWGAACARYVVGEFYVLEDGIRNGPERRHDHASAIGWLLRAADGGFQPAQEQVFQFYSHAENYKLNRKDAFLDTFRKYEAAANDKGDRVAMTNLGMMYQWGVGAQVDLKQAVAWYQKAADKGDGRAMAYLGRLYEFAGAGVIAADPDKALALYKRASDAGNGHGTHNYALMKYEKPANAEEEQALTQLLETAVRQGFPQAVPRLGARYANGLGAARSPEKAFVLYRTLAHNWSTPTVQTAYISALLQGIGTAPDRDGAKAVLLQCQYHPLEKDCTDAWVKWAKID